MRHLWLVILVLIFNLSNAQIKVDVTKYKNNGETKLVINKNLIIIKNIELIKIINNINHKA